MFLRSHTLHGIEPSTFHPARRHEMCDILKMSHKSRRQARLNVLWSLLRDVCDTLDIVFGAADAAGWGTGEDWNASEAPRCNKIFFRITHDPIL